MPLNVIPENITHNLNSVNQTFHKKTHLIYTIYYFKIAFRLILLNAVSNILIIIIKNNNDL